jgi:trimeric autotransporter adhesin
MKKYLLLTGTLFFYQIAFCQNVGINTVSPTASLDVNGDVVFRTGTLIVADGITLALDVNLNKLSYYRMEGPTANFTLAGIAAGADGRLLTLFNRSGFTMQLNNEDATAAASDRIVTGTNANITIPDKGIVSFHYDGNEGRWIVKSSSKGGATGSGTAWNLTGNTLTNPAVNFIGTTDDNDVIFKRNNIRAGLIGATNTSYGINALNPASTGINNTAIGYYAFGSNITGAQNTAIGYGALSFNYNGSANTANGNYALGSNTSGNNNTANGYSALYKNIGADNTANGNLALYNNTSGYSNTANGNVALYSNTNGVGNTANGVGALSSNTIGNFNTALGHFAGVTTGALTNVTAIGYGAQVDADNKVRIGNSSVGSIGGNVGWTNFSDGRIKNNIKENVPGLAFINLLKPVTYNFNLAKEYELMGQKDSMQWESKNDIEKINFTGFVAQDVEAAAKKINYDFSGVDKTGKIMGLRYSEFVVPLVKAMQEQQVMILGQQTLIEDLNKQMVEMKKEIASLKK